MRKVRTWLALALAPWLRSEAPTEEYPTTFHVSTAAAYPVIWEWKRTG